MPFSNDPGFAMASEMGPHAAPSLATFSRNVEQRVSAGVQSVVTSLKKAQEKGKMLEHVKDLVMRETGTITKSYQFKDPLENVFLNEEDRSWTSSELRQVNSKQLLALPTASDPGESHRLVRLIQSHYFLDNSKQFVIVLMQLELQSLSKSHLLTDGIEIAVSVVIRPEKSVSVAWELDAIRSQQEDDTIWLAARSAVSTLAVAPSLDDQHLTISARVADGHLQFLGAFTMSTLLQCAFSSVLVPERGIEYSHPVFRSFHFVAEGRNAQKIPRGGGYSEGATDDTYCTKTREDLALFSFSASCRTTMATSVAQLRAGIDDDASVRGSMCIRPSSLRRLDNFLILLEKETQASREIAAREDTFGYTLPDIKHILELQHTTDNCLGLMEEKYLESWG